MTTDLPSGRPMVRFDFDAVNRWAADPQRKPAIHAFTAGLERNVALLIERNRAEGGTEKQPRCPKCGTHEVSLQQTCHNSACEEYARDVTVYEGWRQPAGR